MARESKHAGRCIVQSVGGAYNACAVREYVYRVDAEGRMFHEGSEIGEPLDPATLTHVGARLYCRVRKGLFRARLGRIALQQIAPYILEDSGGPVLALGGRRYPLTAGSATSLPSA